MKATDKRPLGRTKLKVTVLGLGTATLGNLYAPVSDADAHDTVKTAFDAGVRFVDTAPFYGHGWSEHRVGEALRAYKRDDIVLSTKIGRVLKPKDPGAKGIEGGVFAAVLPSTRRRTASRCAVSRWAAMSASRSCAARPSGSSGWR